MNFLHKKINRNFKRGFTLIELLVVIAIIGLISSMVFANLATAKSKSTNALVVSEKHQLEVAIQTYYNDFGYFPSLSTTGSLSIYACVGANCIWPGKATSTMPNLALEINKEKHQNVFQKLLALTGGTISNQLVGYIPKIYFTQSVFLNNVEYRGITYVCNTYVNNKCTAAAIYYPMFGVQTNARCTDGVNSVIAQNLLNIDTPAPDPTFSPACSGSPYTLNSNSM